MIKEQQREKEREREKKKSLLTKYWMQYTTRDFFFLTDITSKRDFFSVLCSRYLLVIINSIVKTIIKVCIICKDIYVYINNIIQEDENSSSSSSSYHNYQKKKKMNLKFKKKIKHYNMKDKFFFWKKVNTRICFNENQHLYWLFPRQIHKQLQKSQYLEHQQQHHSKLFSKNL